VTPLFIYIDTATIFFKIHFNKRNKRSTIYILNVNSNKYPDMLIIVRSFSGSSFYFVDIDRILAKASQQKQELENYKLKLAEASANQKVDNSSLSGSEASLPAPAATKTFLSIAKGKIDNLIDKQEKVEVKLIDRINDGYEKLNSKKADEIFNKYIDNKDKIKVNTETKALNLESEFSDKLKPVAYFEKKVDIEASGFKKLTQAFEKEEEEINKEIKKGEYYKNNKDQYEKERAEWKEKHVEEVKECRQEKQNIKTILVSNLEKPSEMVEDLLNETGPDYTGGDD